MDFHLKDRTNSLYFSVSYRKKRILLSNLIEILTYIVPGYLFENMYFHVSVFRNLVAKIIDVPMFNPELVKPCPNITMHQFFSYAAHNDPLVLVMNIASECKYRSMVGALLKRVLLTTTCRWK